MRHVFVCGLLVATAHAAAQGHAGTLRGGSSGSYQSAPSSSGGSGTHGHAAAIQPSAPSSSRSYSSGYHATWVGGGYYHHGWGSSSGGGGGGGGGHFPVQWGVTLGLRAAWFNGDLGFASPRSTQPLTTDLLLIGGGELWIWMRIDSVRFGPGIGAGSVVNRALTITDGAAFEADSRMAAAGEVCGAGALQWLPALTPSFDAIVGVRVGACAMAAWIEARGRTYAQLANLFFSGGPELGARWHDGIVVIELVGFLDVAREASGSATLRIGLDWGR